MRALIAVLVSTLVGCGGGGGGGGQAVPVHYTVADFQTAQDFLDNPIVQDMLLRAGIDVHVGSTPPLIEGTYESSEAIVLNDFPPHGTGAVPPYDEVFSGQSAGTISLSGGHTFSQAFITGSGAVFTIWFVVAYGFPGFDCTVVEVDVLSGSVLPGGDIDIRTGGVIVGASGADCDILAAALSGGSVDAMRGLAIATIADMVFMGPP